MNGTNPPSFTIVGEQRRENGSTCGMDDLVKQPKYWRDRAKATRAKAKQLRYDPREMRRMLRVAEEYDKLANRCGEWRGNSSELRADPYE